MNYFKYIRERLFHGHYLVDLEIPSDLRKSIYQLLDESEARKERYFKQELNEEDWDKIADACAIYDSPLMKALE